MGINRAVELTALVRWVGRLRFEQGVYNSPAPRREAGECGPHAVRVNVVAARAALYEGMKS